MGPGHAWLKGAGRVVIDRSQAMDAFGLLCRMEGIIPPVNPHAVAGTLKLGVEIGKGAVIVKCRDVAQRCRDSHEMNLT